MNISLHTATRKILCFIAAFAVCFAYLALTASPVYAEENGDNKPLGISEVSTDSGFLLALSSPSVDVIRLTGDVNAASVDWGTVQKGPKMIVGTLGTERLALPNALFAGEALSFDLLTLVRGAPEGTIIYANSYRFHFGSALTFEDAFITAIFGGGYQATTVNAEILLESGVVGGVYAGANKGILTGTSNITLHGAVVIDGVYGSYENSEIHGIKTLNLTGFGTAEEYCQQLPAVLGMNELLLDNSFIRTRGWPSNVMPDRLTVLQSSSLWLDGDVALPVPLHGEAGELIIAADSVVTLPDPAIISSFATGKLNLSLSGGVSATIVNGRTYRDTFLLPEDFHTGTGANLEINQLFPNRLEWVSFPGQTTYFLRDEVDPSGGIIRVYYNPTELAVTKDVPLSSDMISGFDPEALGIQTLTAEYQGHNCSYDVWVADPAVERLEISAIPAKRTYQLGESLNVSGGEVFVQYNNEVVQKIPFNDGSVVVSGFDSSVPGKLTLGVSYNGQSVGIYEATVYASAITSQSDSSDRNASGKMDILDSEKVVSIKGLPAGNEVEVGETFTLTASPNRRGDWDWNKEYFTELVDDNLNTLTLEALKRGSSRIAYRDETAYASAVVQIKEAQINLDEPVENGVQEIVPDREQLDFSAAESEVGVSRAEKIIGEATSQQEPALEYTPEPAAVKPVAPEIVEQELDDRSLFGGRSDRIPVVIAGILSSITVLAAAGAGIWRYGKRY